MMRVGRQLNFHSLTKRQTARQFGGMLLRGNAKEKRPLSTKEAIHLVLKSHLATGGRSFLLKKNSGRIEFIVRRAAKTAGIKIYHFVNVGNHLHLVIKLDRTSATAARSAFRSFIRSVTGLIARHVLGAERNNGKGIKFWQSRPFTRVLTWGRDYNLVARYMTKNSEQARNRRKMIDWGFAVTDPHRIATLETG
jgi:REP element-mobilizing transposase RayT